MKLSGDFLIRKMRHFDMRMDRSGGRTAADIINNYSRDELIAILRNYGEEKFAPRIVDAIIRERTKRAF